MKLTKDEAFLKTAEHEPVGLIEKNPEENFHTIRTSVPFTVPREYTEQLETGYTVEMAANELLLIVPTKEITAKNIVIIPQIIPPGVTEKITLMTINHYDGDGIINASDVLVKMYRIKGMIVEEKVKGKSKDGEEKTKN